MPSGRLRDTVLINLESYVLLSQDVKEGHTFHQYLPFTFTVTLRYSLSSQGLQQQLIVRNNGTEYMPNLFAFHTAIAVPFAPDSQASDYTAKVTIGQRRELNERSLPTGQFQPLTPEEEQLKKTELVRSLLPWIIITLRSRRMDVTIWNLRITVLETNWYTMWVPPTSTG